MALLLVLIMLGLAAALASAFLGLASVRTMTSQNLTASAEAKTLAESGLAEAVYCLSYPHVLDPTQPDAIWSGVSHRQPDGSSSDYYDVIVEIDAANPLLIKATSTAHIFAESMEKYSRTVRGSYLVNRGFTSGLMSERSLTIPANVTINGNAYSGYSVTNSGTVTGNIESKGTISGAGQVLGRKLPNSPAIEMAACPINIPVTYTYSGNTYTAEAITAATLNNVNWSTPSVTNPMGVYIRNGALTLNGTNRITGTLIITGLGYAENTDTVITAKPGFPAFIFQSAFQFKNNASLTVNGVMVAKHKISAPFTGGSLNSTLTVNGSLVFFGTQGVFDLLTCSKIAAIVINQDFSRASVKKFYPPQPTTPRQVRPWGYESR